MPIFEYEHLLNEDARPPRGCTPRFEHLESRSAPPLSHCPRCGIALRRVPSGFATSRDVLSTSNIKEKGFTRLRRRDKGAYEVD